MKKDKNTCFDNVTNKKKTIDLKSTKSIISKYQLFEIVGFVLFNDYFYIIFENINYFWIPSGLLFINCIGFFSQNKLEGRGCFCFFLDFFKTFFFRNFLSKENVALFLSCKKYFLPIYG